MGRVGGHDQLLLASGPLSGRRPTTAMRLMITRQVPTTGQSSFPYRTNTITPTASPLSEPADLVHAGKAGPFAANRTFWTSQPDGTKVWIEATGDRSGTTADINAEPVHPSNATPPPTLHRRPAQLVHLAAWLCKRDSPSKVRRNHHIGVGLNRVVRPTAQVWMMTLEVVAKLQIPTPEC